MKTRTFTNKLTFEQATIVPLALFPVNLYFLSVAHSRFLCRQSKRLRGRLLLPSRQRSTHSLPCGCARCCAHILMFYVGRWSNASLATSSAVCQPCAPGYYGIVSGLSTPVCNGTLLCTYGFALIIHRPLQRGLFLPTGQSSHLPCGYSSWCAGLDSFLCSGSFCPAGSAFPSPCAAVISTFFVIDSTALQGTFSAALKLTSSAGCAPCPAGLPQHVHVSWARTHCSSMQVTILARVGLSV